MVIFMLPIFPVYHKSLALYIMSYSTHVSGHAYLILNGKIHKENCRQLRPVWLPKTRE